MDLQTYLRFVAALVFVLALIGAFAWLARRFGLGHRIGPLKGPRRLALLDVIALDGKRRLVLVRRDNVEHLLLLGANSEVVVESRIPAREAVDIGGEVAHIEPKPDETKVTAAPR